MDNAAAASKGHEADSTHPATPPPDETHFTLHYVAESPILDATAKRLSAQLGLEADRHAEATAPRSALVRYASADNHAAAREAGKILGEMGYSWKIEPATNRSSSTSPQRGLEIWLPNR